MSYFSAAVVDDTGFGQARNEQQLMFGFINTTVMWQHVLIFLPRHYQRLSSVDRHSASIADWSECARTDS